MGFRASNGSNVDDRIQTSRGRIQETGERARLDGEIDRTSGPNERTAESQQHVQCNEDPNVQKK